MTIKDLLTLKATYMVQDAHFDIDISGFTGPLTLTNKGFRKWGSILDVECKVEHTVYGLKAIVNSGKKFNKVEDFFFAAAGFCTHKQFERWFGQKKTKGGAYYV